MLLVPIVISVFTSIFILVNFIAYLIKGKVITRKEIWIPLQVWTVAVAPALFLAFMDLYQENDCCSSSAIFSPDHRIAIYTLIVLGITSYLVGVFREDILAPLAEVFHNSFLILGLVLNFLFCWHFTTIEDGPFLWIFGNAPIIMLFLIMLVENQRRINRFTTENEYTSDTSLGRVCASIIELEPTLKFPILTVLLIPFLILLSLFLLVFGQKPDSLIRAFTDTYKHGFSQLDYMCDNVSCGGHFLCSVGADGHKAVVKPIRYGERNGAKIICTRQLLVSNAFEELVAERLPSLHQLVRRNYNKVGDVVHKHYHFFNIKFVSDIVYLLMKPLEWFFLVTLYSFDQKPENRIAKQYLSKGDREAIRTNL